MKKKKRIMHGLSEVAGQNSFSVKGLNEIGLDAQTVVFTPNPFGYPYDINLNIQKNNFRKFPIYILKLMCFFIFSICRYDVFHFHFGRSICYNFDLWILDLLKKEYFYEFHGSDIRNMEVFCKNSFFEYSDDLKMSKRTIIRNRYICRKATGIILHDDELIPYLPPEHVDVYVVPLRVNIDSFVPCFPEIQNQNVKIVHAPSKRAIKGTSYLLKAFENLSKKYKNIELVLVEGKNHEEALEIYSEADIIVDQLFIGTYGVFAIESMALGKPVITYISDEMKERLPINLPIVSASINDLEMQLEKLILDPSLRNQLGKEGRKYAETYHDYKKNALILSKIYNHEIQPSVGRDAFENVKNFSENC